MYVNKINVSALPDDWKHYIDPNDFNKVIYHQRSTDTDERMKQFLTDADKLLALCESAYNDWTEYDLFVRCLSEQTIVENESRRLRMKEDGGMKSTMRRILLTLKQLSGIKQEKSIEDMLPILKNLLELMVLL